MDDTENPGGEETSLSVEQAATAYAKSLNNEADKGQAEVEDNAESDNADDDLSLDDEQVEDGEPDDEGQAEDEGNEEPESDQGRFIARNGKVKLDDGTVLTVDELIAGNLKERDYRQKTMTLAEARREFEEQSSAFKASQEQTRQQAEYLQALLESVTPQPPSISLLQEDPTTYLQMKENYEAFQKHSEYLKSQLAESKAGETKQTQQQRAERAKSEWDRLVSVMPDLKNEDKLKSFTDDMKRFGGEYGFSSQELGEFLPFDHRYSLVMNDAIKWRKLQAQKANVKKQIENKPPVQKSGKRLSGAERRASNANDAVNRLKETGRVEDAVKAYLASKG